MAVLHLLHKDIVSTWGKVNVSFLFVSDFLFHLASGVSKDTFLKQRQESWSQEGPLICPRGSPQRWKFFSPYPVSPKPLPPVQPCHMLPRDLLPSQLALNG